MITLKKSDTPQGQDSTPKEAEKSKNSLPISEGIPSGTEIPPTVNKDKETKAQKESVMWSRLKKQITIALIVEILIFAVTIKIACIYSGQLNQMIRANNLTQQALNRDRPWVGVNGDVGFSKLNPKNEVFQFVVSYRVKNFGASPALNTVVQFGNPIEDVRDLHIYDLTKGKVNDACQTAENVVGLTGDLLLPTGDKPDTWTFGEKAWKGSFIIPGCLVYRDTGGKMHHTQLCYVIDDSGKSGPFRTCWFQYAD